MKARIIVIKLCRRLEERWLDLCSVSKWHCNNMEGRKYIPNELVDFPEDIIR